MKTRALVSILILALAVVIIAGSCATEKKAYVAKENEELYGTWINEDYNNTTGIIRHYAKEIRNPDGTFALYLNEFDTKPYMIGKSIITDSWTDSEGNIWFKEEYYIGAYFEGKKVSEYRLTKISNSGRTLEGVDNAAIAGYPTEIDPTNSWYHILYRQ